MLGGGRPPTPPSRRAILSLRCRRHERGGDDRRLRECRAGFTDVGQPSESVYLRRNSGEPGPGESPRWNFLLP